MPGLLHIYFTEMVIKLKLKMSALANNYNRRNISFQKGKGSFLYTSKGVKYLDFVQGIAVNSLGHSNQYLNKALIYF